MKYAFILHGFNGDTLYTFGPSLKKFLEEHGYTVFAPSFPIRSEASFSKWSDILDEYKQYFTPETLVVAHSIGNPFFIKYFSKNKLKIKLYISVAGFCDLFTVDNRDDLNHAFIDFAVNNQDIEYCVKNISQRFSLYSDNDHVVPFDVLQNFTKRMQSTSMFIKGVGHMGNRDNISHLPQIEEIFFSVFPENNIKTPTS